MTAAAGVALLIAYAGYRTLRPGAGRFFGDFFYPYLAVARFAGDQVSNRSLLAYSRPELAAQVEKLMAVNRRLSAEAAAAKEFEEENLQLRRLLKLDPPAAWRYVAAEVILRDPVLWNEHFTIDRGTAAGVSVNDPVVGNSGIVASLHHCKDISIKRLRQMTAVRRKEHQTNIISRHLCPQFLVCMP